MLNTILRGMNNLENLSIKYLNTILWEWKLFKVVGQFGLHYRDQAQGFGDFGGYAFYVE